MLLAIDIGNTSISCGIFDSDKLVHKFRFPSDKYCSIAEYKKKINENTKEYKISDCVIASVVDELTGIIKQAAYELYIIEALVISSSIDLGFKLNIESPETAGADRIANTAAARQMYPLPAIIIDLGTATTFDIVDKNGNFIGGIIMPGLKIQLDSLNQKTSKLPLAEISLPQKIIGKNTIDSMLSGVVRGHVNAIEQLLKDCTAELGDNPTVIATGGYTEIISQCMRNKFDYTNQNLTLEGMKIIYKHCKTKLKQ